MASRIRTIYNDVVNRKAYAGFNSLLTSPIADFFLSDEEILNIIPMQPNPDNTSSQKFIPIVTNGSYYSAVGKTGLYAQSGTFLLIDPIVPATTSALDSQITASALQAALRLLATYAACTVVQNKPGYYTIDRVTAGVLANPLTGDGTDLFPQSFANVNILRTGSSLVSQVVELTLDQAPAAYIDSGWSALPSAAVVVDPLVTGSASQNAVFRVSINPDSYAGSFILSSAVLGSGNNVAGSSAPIDFDTTDINMQQQINTGWGTGNEVTVYEVNQYTWDVVFTGDNLKLKNLAAPSGNAAGLSVPVGITGNLSFLTNAANSQLAGDPSTAVTFQIKNVDSNGVPQTWLFAPCTLNSSLINPATLGASSIAYPLTETQGDARYARQANNGSDFANLLTTLQNLWLAATTTAGAFLYMGAASVLSVLAPNTTGTRKFLSMASSVPSWQIPATGSSTWVVQTVNYSLNPGDYIIDGAGSLAFTLPAATGSGVEIDVVDGLGTWAAIPSTIITSNGTDNINGSNAVLNLNVNWGGVRLVDVSAGNWQAK